MPLVLAIIILKVWQSDNSWFGWGKKESKDSESEPVSGNSVSSNQKIEVVCDYDDLECLLYNNNGGWYSDPKPNELYVSRCDFDRIDVQKTNFTVEDFERLYLHRKPVILEGAIEDWKAKERWTRKSFFENYGAFPTQVSPGSVIVFGGGGDSSSSNMNKYLMKMEKHMTSPETNTQPFLDFNFDTRFLRAMPVMYMDFKTPSYFNSFNSFESVKETTSWHMLSLGATRGGLPSHVHGETWLGLVYGMKRWFVYAPGTGPTLQTLRESGYHRLEGSWSWFRKVYPMAMDSNSSLEKPMECIQKPGDIIYLPRNWKHTTINIGEALGVGGQAGYPAVLRLEDNAFTLEKNPKDFEALLGFGLSSAHLWLAHHDRDHLKRALKFLDKAIEMDPFQPEAYLIKGEILLKRKNFEEADQHIANALQVFSRANIPETVPLETVVGVQLKFAQIYLAFDDGASAEPLLRKVLELLPDLTQAWQDLAYALVEQDRLQEAESALTEALKRSPNDNNCKILQNKINWKKELKAVFDEAASGKTKSEDPESPEVTPDEL